MEEIEDLLLNYPFDRISKKKRRLLRKKYKREYRKRQKKEIDTICGEKQKSMDTDDLPEWVLIDGGTR